MAWNLSTPDRQNRIRTGQSLIPDLPLLDKVAAERAVNVFDRLRLPDVAGKPLLKAAAGDWFGGDEQAPVWIAVDRRRGRSRHLDKRRPRSPLRLRRDKLPATAPVVRWPLAGRRPMCQEGGNPKQDHSADPKEDTLHEVG